MARKTAKQNEIQNRTSIWRWLFVPPKPINYGKWALRAIGGTIATFVIIAAVLAFAFGIMYGIGILSAMPAAFMMLGNAAAAKPVILAFITLALFIINAFAFMPRAELSRRGFFAATLTGIAWVLGASLIGEFINPNIPVIPFVITVVIFLSAIMMLAGALRYAEHIGVSKWQQFLSFPFGTSFFCFCGLFLDQPNDVNIGAKTKWFSNIIGFLTNNKIGRILLGVLVILGLFEPWSLLLATVFLIAWIARGAKWIFQNMPTLAWVAAAVNIATVITLVSILQFYPELTSGAIAGMGAM
ncbi:MAG: hypothetical protein LBR41_02595 [Rickettsiales bacterium]|jgi:hypothetical protein|nr:hypothetical protein [Rickettsiales bacterium]